jgi:hypothetical protein
VPNKRDNGGDLYSLRSQQRRQVVDTPLEPRSDARAKGTGPRCLSITEGAGWPGPLQCLGSEGRSTDSFATNTAPKLTGHRDEFYNVNLSIPNHPRVFRVWQAPMRDPEKSTRMADIKDTLMPP